MFYKEKKYKRINSRKNFYIYITGEILILSINDKMISLNRLFFIFFVTYYIFHFHLINASFHDSLRDNKKGIDTKIRGAPVENTDSDEVKNIHQAMSSFYKSYTTAKSHRNHSRSYSGSGRVSFRN